MANALIFTEKAAVKVGVLIAEVGNPNLKLRAFVTGGGCSGFKYGFTFEEAAADDDTVISKEVTLDSGPALVQLLVDPLSLQYLVGAEIDYQQDLNGEQFIIRNPGAKTTCGCGSSFSVEED